MFLYYSCFSDQLHLLLFGAELGEGVDDDAEDDVHQDRGDEAGEGRVQIRRKSGAKQV